MTSPSADEKRLAQIAQRQELANVQLPPVSGADYHEPEWLFLKRLLDALQARLTQAERERDEARAIANGLGRDYNQKCHSEKAAQERASALAAALKPFADFADRFGDTAREDSWVLTRNPSGKGDLTMGDVRRAREALSQAAVSASPAAHDERN